MSTSHTTLANPAMRVDLDRSRLRRNVQQIRQRTGTEVWAVVKADAYGLGAQRVAGAIADLVDGFCVFALAEAVEADLWRLTARPIIALGPPQGDADAHLHQHVRPAVSSVDQAQRLRSADPLVCVDTGMQRFACPIERVGEVIEAGGCREAFTHATSLEHVRLLQEALGDRPIKRHAAATALLDQPQAHLDAVRPGLALYRGAVTVHTPLAEVHVSRGPVGYTRFSAQRHGVILAGYTHGLRRGPCLINGQPRQILEVGMQSAYVETGPDDRPGDSVILLGERPGPEMLATSWQATPHEILLRLAQGGTVRLVG